MKRISQIIMLGLFLLACVCGCAASVQEMGHVQIPNPIHEMTAEALSEKLGVSFGVPEDAENAEFTWIDGAEIAQAVFIWCGDAYSFRAKRADPEHPEEEISGMYYEWTWTNAASGASPAIYLTDEGQGYAAWSTDGVLYSVSMDAGATEQKLSDMVGLLRGAFYPTVQYDKIPMVMVDGKLYYDTGRESTDGKKYGTVDGYITSTVDGSQTPTEHNQSNFGEGYCYRIGYAKDTIEIYLNEKWIIFEHRPGDGSTQIYSIAFSAQYVRTDGTPDGMTYPAAEVICSREELAAYYEAHRDLYDLERREQGYADQNVGFLDACDAYDHAYFDAHSLVLIRLEEPSGSIRHKVTSVRQDAESGVWIVSVDRLIPEVFADDMANWHIFLEADGIGSGDAVRIELSRRDPKYSEEYMNAQLVRIDAGGGYVFPYQHFAYSREWTGKGFLYADGTWVEMELMQLAERGELPQITYAPDFCVTYAPQTKFNALYLFDDRYARMGDSWPLSKLESLLPGSYYVGILVDEQGDYIGEVEEHEYTGMVCLFQLIVK